MIKVGDRTVSVNGDTAGLIGNVIDTDSGEGTAGEFNFAYWILVEFDEYSKDRHSGDGLGKEGHCWWIPTEWAELAEPIKLENV